MEANCCTCWDGYGEFVQMISDSVWVNLQNIINNACVTASHSSSVIGNSDFPPMTYTLVN